VKYIILETPDGRRMPIIFPEALTHCFVAGAMQLVVDTLDPKKDLRPRQLDGLLKAGNAKPISAGFVDLHEVSVHGESESLGGLKSRHVDEGYISFGDACAYTADHIVADLLNFKRGER